MTKYLDNISDNKTITFLISNFKISIQNIPLKTLKHPSSPNFSRQIAFFTFQKPPSIPECSVGQSSKA